MAFIAVVLIVSFQSIWGQNRQLFELKIQVKIHGEDWDPLSGLNSKVKLADPILFISSKNKNIASYTASDNVSSFFYTLDLIASNKDTLTLSIYDRDKVPFYKIEHNDLIGRIRFLPPVGLDTQIVFDEPKMKVTLTFKPIHNYEVTIESIDLSGVSDKVFKDHYKKGINLKNIRIGRGYQLFNEAPFLPDKNRLIAINRTYQFKAAEINQCEMEFTLVKKPNEREQRLMGNLKNSTDRFELGCHYIQPGQKLCTGVKVKARLKKLN